MTRNVAIFHPMYLEIPVQLVMVICMILDTRICLHIGSTAWRQQGFDVPRNRAGSSTDQEGRSIEIHGIMLTYRSSNKHWWCSGNIGSSHGLAPGSTPGQCIVGRQLIFASVWYRIYFGLNFHCKLNVQIKIQEKCQAVSTSRRSSRRMYFSNAVCN